MRPAAEGGSSAGSKRRLRWPCAICSVASAYWRACSGLGLGLGLGSGLGARG